MGELRVRISDIAHGKLNMLCKIFNKTQDEIIEELILRASMPRLAVEILVADEAGGKMEEVKLKPEIFRRRKVEILDAEKIEKKS